MNDTPETGRADVRPQTMTLAEYLDRWNADLEAARAEIRSRPLPPRPTRAQIRAGVDARRAARLARLTPIVGAERAEAIVRGVES